MVAPSLSSRGKPAKFLKKGTETTKSHRFETFSQRVTKLKIDPIHRVRRTGFGEEDGEEDETFSHFRSSQDHWSEMNLSEFFTEFVRRVGPLSENLPQVLYHEEKIMALLIEFIDKRDKLSIEPLLSLLSQFARDLGVRFEGHFAASVTLVASVAATHPDVEVIEWSFTSLAWIFKFLSRLLVPDLRQLLNIMTPYLGKERQKPFVVRFAAESMSFLIRKAGLVYHKNKIPLNRAISFLFEDLRNSTESPNVDAYQEGLMAMFSESIKGINRGLYSNGSDILKCLIDNAIVGDELQLSLSEEVVCGVLTSIIHATTPDTFSELLKVVCAFAETEHSENSDAHLKLSSHLMFVCVVTRKATRVKGWKSVHPILLTLLQRALGELESQRTTVPRILTTIAYALQLSPMDEMMPFMRPTMEAVSDERLVSFFLSFCSTFSEFGSERFQIIVLPYFQRFLGLFWKTKEEDLCLSLIQLEEAGCVTSVSSRPGFINCPAEWRTHIVERLNKPGASLDETAILNAYSRLRSAISFSNDASIIPQMLQPLHDLLVVSLNDPTLDDQPLNIFSCGQGFQTYVDLADQCNCLDKTLWQLIVKTGARFTRRLAFLEATFNYLTRLPGLITESKEELDLLAGALTDNLTSPSHSLRLLSLRILLELVKATTGDVQNTISTAIEIEESELSLQTARFLSMQVRKLGLSYPQVISHSWLSRMVPKFCFGLFSKKLGQLWSDSAEALKVISQHAAGEVVVTELCMLWLQHNGNLNDEPASDEDSRKTWTDFQCVNALRIEGIIEARFQAVKEPKDLLIESFNISHTASVLLPKSARARSLQVLHVIPEVAEKRSRQIVPLFLRWASTEGYNGKPLEIDPKSSTTVTAEEDAPLWAYKDRIALLELFEKFINPRSLFKSSDVYDALLTLTAHGDSTVQKSALKGLFTWKSPNVRPYEENLLNILDESRFREELAVFVHLDDSDSKIEKGHKAEMLPILLRLLYGRMISRAASSSGSGGQSGRRKAILRVLSQLSEADFELFVQIAFGNLHSLNLLKENQIDNQCFDLGLVSERRQIGFLKMVETMLETLQSRMHVYAIKSMDAVIYCLVRASRSLAAETQDALSLESKSSMLREIRSVGIRCLCLIFSIAPDIDWTPYVRLIFHEVINPRLENFAIENAQGVSAYHRLFHEWVVPSKSIFYLTRFNSNVVPAVVDTLTVPSARDDVKVYIMEQIIQPIVNHATGRAVDETEVMSDIPPESIRVEVLAPYVDRILSLLGKLLQSSPPRPVLVSAVETLSLIAPCVETSDEISSLVRISTYLLRQPQDKISPKTKSGLLHSLQHFIPLSSISEDPSFAEEVFSTVSSLFDYFKDEPNRNVLSSVLREFAKHDSELEEVSLLCVDLNAIDTQKLDSVDYDRRLKAFAKINEKLWTSLSPKQWRPLLFNMLFHVKDEQELAIRSSASFGIKRFIERAADGESNQSSFASLRDDILIPALQSGVRQRSEAVRAEFLSAFGHLIKLNVALPSVQDMHILLVSGDEEASFFNNILHIQQHRRMRALRRLASEVSNGKIGSSNIGAFFFPLIEHFVFHVAEDETAHNLAAEAVATLGGLAEWLEWNQFRAIFRRYRANMTSRPEVEKNMIRLLGRMTDALSTAFTQRHTQVEPEDNMELDNNTSDQSTKCRLALTLPAASKIATELTTHFLPFLTEFVHHKDEAQMSLRLPVAVTSIKLLKLLPEEDMAIRLPSVLLDVCYVLRSKAQDSRDNARKTLADVAIILGPSYFGYILKELRTALARGYQLHVLSFTMHSILVSTTDEFAQGSLDHCVTDAVAVVMDDIFGVVGQEKDAEDYVSQMKEVKSSKSYDSMELLAKNSSVACLGALIAPLQLLLREKLTATLVRKIDELFRRIGLGLLRNPHAESRDMLVFCYEVIKESYVDHSDSQKQKSAESARNRRFLINMQGMKRGEKRGSTSSYLYKLSRFALDILRSILNKFSSLLTTNNLAGFLPIVSDAVIQSYEEVKISAMRLLSTIIKLPLDELDRNAPTYLAEAVKLIKEAPNTNTEAAQAALKFIASVLRERKTVELRDNHLSYLLKRLTSDIEEPDRQGLTFNFIRAVMDRKFLVPELYELVDNIAKMMVTNQTRAARDLARGVYIHFLLEYPQAKNRWSKQLAFLAKNFEYQHREGRESVMEAVHRLLNKTGGDLGQGIISTFFLPVVLVMTNDETSECRQLAGLLLSEFFARADRERLQIMLKPLHVWLEQMENKQLASTGLQAMRIFFEAEGVTEKEKESRFITDILPPLINPIIEDTESEDWETLYFSWQLFSKISKAVPSVAFSKESRNLWSAVQESLFYPHAWVKTCAANLIGLWLADLAKTNAAQGYSNVPLAGKYGLELDTEGMIKLTRGSIRSIQTPGVSEELAMQSVRNIVFLSRCFAVNGVEFSPKEAQEASEDATGDASDAEAGKHEDINGTANGVASSRSLLHYVFWQISDILRRESTSGKANVLVSKSASMALLAAICRHLESEKLIGYLSIILLPLQHLIDPNIPAPRSSDPDFQANWKSLITNAQEILDLLQKKFGTTEYVAHMARIQENIKARREERRVKRRIEAVADPEKFGREKKRKNDRKHFKRKERGQEFRERRRGF